MQTAWFSFLVAGLLVIAPLAQAAPSKSSVKPIGSRAAPKPSEPNGVTGLLVVKLKAGHTPESRERVAKALDAFAYRRPGPREGKPRAARRRRRTP